MPTRRSLLAGSLALALRGHAESVRTPAVPPSLDHVILGVRDLDEGVAWVHRRVGIRATPGGVHSGRGTRNALLALGPRRYLEIMAPDPAQPPGADSRDLRALEQPRILGWASHLADLQSVAARLRGAGVAFEGPTPGSRQRPDGRRLAWQTLNLKNDLEGVLPFFIEWGEGSAHPADDAPAGLTLARLVAATPRHADAAGVVQSIDLGLQVQPALATHLAATVRNGTRELAF